MRPKGVARPLDFGRRTMVQYRSGRPEADHWSMGPPRERSFRWVVGPVLQFTLLGLFAVVVVGVATAVASRRVGEREAITDARTTTLVKAQSAAEPVVVDGLVSGDPGALARVDGVVRTQVLEPSLVRSSCWATGWPTRPSPAASASPSGPSRPTSAASSSSSGSPTGHRPPCGRGSTPGLAPAERGSAPPAAAPADRAATAPVRAATAASVVAGLGLAAVVVDRGRRRRGDRGARRRAGRAVARAGPVATAVVIGRRGDGGRGGRGGGRGRARRRRGGRGPGRGPVVDRGRGAGRGDVVRRDDDLRGGACAHGVGGVGHAAHQRGGHGDNGGGQDLVADGSAPSLGRDGSSVRFRRREWPVVDGSTTGANRSSAER